MGRGGERLRAVSLKRPTSAAQRNTCLHFDFAHGHTAQRQKAEKSVTVALRGSAQSGSAERSGTDSARSSMEWVPGGVWVASMLPDLSGFVETLKDAVSPRTPVAPKLPLPLR